MHGILQTRDGLGHLYHLHVNNEGNIYTQQEKLQESIKNPTNNDHSCAELPYQQINLQVLRPLIPVQKDNVQHKE